MQDIKHTLLVLLLLISVSAVYGQSYTSIASGSWSDAAVWSLPWVGAPVPPAGSQYVIISAGHTITGSTSNTYQLTVNGTLTFNGDYSNGAGGLVINDGGTFVITGNLNSTSSITINGSGKLIILGNLSENGGSIIVNGTGVLVVGTNFTEGWQTVTLNNNATLLVVKDFYVQGNLTAGTNTVVAVLGTTTGGGCSTCTNTIPTNSIAWTSYNEQNATVWTGATDTSWGTASNWSPTTVPVSNTSIAFSTSASHDLILDADRTVFMIKNLSSKSLIIPAGKCLTVTTTITTSNDPNQIYIKSGSTGSGSLIFHNAAGSPVYGTVEMYSLASWNLANAAGSKYRWQFFGIPVRTLASASPIFDGAYVRQMNENDSPAHWYQLSNTSGLTSFSGYEITQAAAKTYIFQGILENRDYSVQQSYTSGASSPGLNLIANSYTAAIDITKMTFGSQMLATVYLYNTGTRNDWLANGQNADSTATLAGQYTAVPFALAGQYTLPGQIPSMQAFLVRAKKFDTNATLSIPYATSSTVVKNTTTQRVSAATKENSDSDRVWTQIEIKGSRLSDQMWILINPDCTGNYDDGWDGEKFLGPANAPQIYSMEADDDYQVNATNEMNNTDIGFRPGEDSVYTLTISNHNFSTKYSGMYLYDLEQNTINHIPENGGSYTFTAPASTTPVKRFKIIARHNSIINSVANPNENTNQLSVFSSDKTIFVDNSSNVKGNLTLYTISGQLIKTLSFTANTITTIPVNLTPGTYIARAKTPTADVKDKVLIR